MSRGQYAAFTGYAQVFLRFTWGYSGSKGNTGVKPEESEGQLRDAILHRLLTERARGFATMGYWTKAAPTHSAGTQNE